MARTARTLLSRSPRRASARRRTVPRGVAVALVSVLMVSGPLALTSSGQVMPTVADVEITDKTDSDDPVFAGDPLTYEIDIRNNGPVDDAENVVVRDFGPAGVVIDSVSGTSSIPPADPATCQAGVPGDPDRPSRCNFGNMEPNETGTMTIEVTVLPQTTDQLNNDAEISTDSMDPDQSNNLALEITDVDTQADIEITKLDSPDSVRAGTPLDYTLKVKNLGPSTGRQVTLTDRLPDEVTFLSVERNNSAGVVGGECSHVVGFPTQPPDRVECQLNDLDPGEFVVVEIHTLVKSATTPSTITNTAEATTLADDDPGSPNTMMQLTDVVDPADLVIVKTSDLDVYKPSSTIKYTLTVTNLGPADAVNVVVTDTLPAPDVAPYLFDTNECSFSAPITLTCSLGTMTDGETKSFNVYVRVKGNQHQIPNTADVESDNVTADPVLANNTSTRIVCVTGGSPKIC
jgi:uncharacterized repeat protein (TIGR01451 family)